MQGKTPKLSKEVLPGAYADAMRRWFSFHGRSSRSQYWCFLLSVFLVSFTLGLFERFAGFDDIFDTLIEILLLIHAIPFIALCTRRLHDFDKSGMWWTLIFIIGALLFIGIGFPKSSPGPNHFGYPPGEEDNQFAEAFD